MGGPDLWSGLDFNVGVMAGSDLQQGQAMSLLSVG